MDFNYSEEQLRAENSALSDEERVMLERARQAVATRPRAYRTIRPRLVQAAAQ